MLTAAILYQGQLDAEGWAARHRAGEVPDLWPYGLNHLRDYGVTARIVPPLPKVPRAVSALENRSEHQWRHALRAGAADVLLSWDERAGVPAALLRRTPVVTGVIWATETLDRLTTRGLRAAAGVWVSSEAQLPILKSAGVATSRYVPMGVDSAFFHATPYAPGGVVLSCGNDRHRDFATLVRAHAGLAERTELRIFTSSTSVASPAIRGRIPHAALRREYAEASLVVVPLQPNLHVSGVTTVLEAMASARPVVVTRNPGMDAYVEDGVTGVLVTPGDPDEMEMAIRGLLNDPERAAEMGRRGRSRVEQHFTTRLQAERLAALLGECA